MSCINFRKRSKNYEVIFYCKSKRQVITLEDCKNCSERILKRNKPIKNKSNKLAKVERKRTSIIQNDKERCFVCNKKLYVDKDEAFGGSNRQTSIKWNLIYYLCRKCHSEKDINKELRQKLHDHAREIFVEKYGEELFLKEFGKNYIEK